MSDDIKKRAQGIEPSAHPRNVDQIAAKTGNVYHSLAVIAKRSNQISINLKEELKGKLEEFSVGTDTLEEVNENKEQIEISKFYERLPNPAMIAAHEFMNDELNFRKRDRR